MQKAHKLKLTYIGGPTLLIEFGNLRLLTDPTFDPPGDYVNGPASLSKTKAPALDASTIGGVDAVLLSHDHHPDNLDHAGRKFLSSAKTVVTTQEGAERLQGNSVGLAPWQSLELVSQDGKILRVIGTPARHGPENGDRGPVLGFILAYDESPEDPIYISGDTVWYEGVQEILQRYPHIRVAVIFLGAARIPILPSHLTFTAQEGVLVASALPQATIVPVHFEGWKHFSESKQEVSQAFAEAGLEDQLLWLTPGQATAV